ncbi:hypothetical protein FDP41_002584 [Naegleria fowleri]|uniref:RGS domain-containing protein n=1 Tax=Naegleria fowleri TaxID=5763 RepID=A0A6A5BYQ8_NAEFO|nr:uncharacterized protein FDP41_002584 [Naegleria fowleri]KAF0978069.1 hypothetical protein FDP41_002584 [Naegleria fowleri]CAG4710806.1 unnamed protein product [Naegleria fowleri]
MSLGYSSASSLHQAFHILTQNPQQQQQQQREINFESFLSNEECKQVFKEYLSRSKCEEIILFWDELNAYKSYYQQVLLFYKKGSLRKKNKLVLSLFERANYIVNAFINSNSVLELNLDSKIKVRVCEALESVNKKLSVEGDVFSMLHEDPMEVLTCTMDSLHPNHLFGEVETSVCIDLKIQIPAFIRSSIGSSFILTKGAEFFNRMEYTYPTCQLMCLFNNSFSCQVDEISHAIALGRENAYTQWQCIKKCHESFPYELHISQASFGVRIAKLEMLIPIEKDELVQVFASMEFRQLMDDVMDVQHCYCNNNNQMSTPRSEGSTPRNKEFNVSDSLTTSGDCTLGSITPQVSFVSSLSPSSDDPSMLDSSVYNSSTTSSLSNSGSSSPRIQLCTSSRLLTLNPTSLFSKKERTLEYIQTTVYDPDIETIIHISKTLDRGVSKNTSSLSSKDLTSILSKARKNRSQEHPLPKQHFSHFLFQNNPVLKNSSVLVNIFSCESSFRCKQQIKARAIRILNALNIIFERRRCQQGVSNANHTLAKTGKNRTSLVSLNGLDSNLDDPLGIIKSLQENNEKFPHKRWASRFSKTCQ